MTYQIRQRQSLVDQNWFRVLIKRSQELWGLLLLLLSGILGLILGSYSPFDPGIFSLTNGGVSNLLGHFGASVASSLIVILGLGSWIMALYMFFWGIRFMSHAGTGRFMKSLIYFPILIATASVFSSTLQPLASWNHHFGLGGIFGDTFVGATMNALPLDKVTFFEFAKFVVGFLLLIICFYTFGFTLREVVGRLTQRQVTRESNSQNGPYQIPANTLDQEDVPPSRGVLNKLDSFLRRNDKEESRSQDFYEYYEQEDEVEEKVRRKGSISKIFKAGISQSVAWLTKEEETVRPRKLTQISFAKRQVHSEHEQQSSATLPLLGDVSQDQPQDFDEDDPDTIVVTRDPRQLKVSARATQETLQSLDNFPDQNTYNPPSLSFLTEPDEIIKNERSQGELEARGEKLKGILADFSVQGRIEKILQGPVVTLYKFRPAPGVKTSRVIQLADDVACSMSALSARISTIPGEPYVGIELPNEIRETVYLKELASSTTFWNSRHKLPLIFGKDISGLAVVVDLVSMPHLLIAGTTGSGKSVGLNSMILSMLYKLSPDQCKLLMIDPKMIELSGYDGIPHLISPVVTDPKKAVVALKWVTYEMNKRYEKMQSMRLNIKNIQSYNSHMLELMEKGEKVYSIKIQTGYNKETGRAEFTTKEFEVEYLPYIVVIIDELADLVQTAGKEIDECLQQLSQKARASGIHLIAATQRPSVDVMGGIIKSNFPNRVSFQVSSKIDSRTILNTQGAEQLLGKGDMLFMSGGGKIQRVHGPLVTDEEVEKVVGYLKKTYGSTEHQYQIFDDPEGTIEAEVDQALGFVGGKNSEDSLYPQAVEIVRRDRRVSISYIQRKLGIGYNKAAKIVERMEDEDLIGKANHVGKREIFMPE